MRHALEIQEILLNIFGHSYLPHTRKTSDLGALAGTCHAFKEPALDVLWRELADGPSPVARCLPEASHHWQISPGNKVGWFQVFVSLCLVVSLNIFKNFPLLPGYNLKVLFI